MAETIVDTLTALVVPIVEDMQLEFVELIYRKEQHGWVIRIIIYAEEGVTLEHCQGVSREVSYLLDVEDFITRKYHLEVTSPGLDRPLTTPRDFERNMGKKIKVTLDDGSEVLTVTGQIKDVTGDDITLHTDQEEIEFHCHEVKKARLIIEF